MDIVVTAVVGVVLALVGFAVGWGLGRAAGVNAGRREGRDEGVSAGRTEAAAETERQLRAFAQAVSRGRRPEDVPAGSPVAELQRALEMGWAPREQERERALREAVGRVAAFLETSVRAPLAGATPDTSAAELHERIERALGALQDLDFFTREPATDVAGVDLPPLVQQVTREFARDQGVGVRIALDGRPVRARVNGPGLMDSLYLVLHNAARFGGGATVDVTVVTEGDQVIIRIRDRGPGFAEEAFQRAFDPFYSTTDDGLGLGLPHARKAVEAMGGRIELRNVPDGGGEVVLSFPAA